MSKDIKRPARTVIIVEDERAVRHLVRVALEKINYKVLEATSAKEMFDLIEGHEVDLVLLDLFLEDEHGVEVCRSLRDEISAPIIIISSMSGELNMVQGLEAGADMYLEKPFSVPVLLASIKSLFRRIRIDKIDDSLSIMDEEENFDESLRRAKGGLAPEQDYTVKLGQWLFIPKFNCLKNDSGKNVSLTKNDMALLNLFIQHHNQILARDDIAKALKLDQSGESSRVVDVQVSRLRSKLKDKSNNNLIKSIRNKGYILNSMARVCSEFSKIVS
jgi:two-component system, OmpR family, response regulator